MLIALLAAAAVTATAAPDPEKVLDVCQRAHSMQTVNAARALYGQQWSQDPDLRAAVEDRLTLDAMAQNGIPASQLKQVQQGCVAYIMGQLDGMTTQTFNVDVKWRYPDGREVPLKQYLANLPIARN